MFVALFPARLLVLTHTIDNSCRVYMTTVPTAISDNKQSCSSHQKGLTVFNFNLIKTLNNFHVEDVAEYSTQQ